MNRKQNLEVFAKTPVRKAVLLQIVPAVASQMVTLVYNLADTYFVGMLNAPHETAAVTVAYPSFLMLTDISNLFVVGGASAIARALGRQDEEGARRIAAVSLAGGLLSALLFSAAFRLLADPVLHLCGATEATYATAYGYAKWVVILGGPFTILNTLLANLVRAEGGAGAAAVGGGFGGGRHIRGWTRCSSCPSSWAWARWARAWPQPSPTGRRWPVLPSIWSAAGAPPI